MPHPGSLRCRVTPGHRVDEVTRTVGGASGGSGDVVSPLMGGSRSRCCGVWRTRRGRCRCGPGGRPRRGHVADVVHPVFDVPLPAGPVGQVGGLGLFGGQGGDQIRGLPRGLALADAGTGDAYGLLGVRETQPAGGGDGDRLERAGLLAAVASAALPVRDQMASATFMITDGRTRLASTSLDLKPAGQAPADRLRNGPDAVPALAAAK